MATTLAQLTTLAQQESDNVNSSFVAAAEWTSYINKSLTEIYGLTAQVYGSDYYVTDPPYTFVTDGVNQKFSLPADFFKLLGVAVQVQSPQQFVTLKPFAVADRFRVSMFNQQIPAAGQTVQLEYIPRVTLLVNASDTIPDALSMNGWDEYIVVDAAIKALAKEESDVSEFKSRKQALIARIEAEADNRDAANPPRIIDVTGRRARAMQYRLWGAKLWLVGGTTPGWSYDGGDWNGMGDYDGNEFY